MKYSLTWIKEHLASELPDIDTVVREVTLRAFEVEDMVQEAEDSILEIKVLPDRAHDALSHRGMAREIGALLGLERKSRIAESVGRDSSVPRVRVIVEDNKLCPRYIATRINNVTISTSPKDIARKLESVGGRSINNVVDITNFILFDIGQPLHVFDADKVVGGISVRLARQGEVMITLDNKEFTLDGTELVIADDKGVLALAGIKGGKKAEVTVDTKNLILESANFGSTITRKTSQKHNIKTDASKRYENGMTSAFALEGCDMALALMQTYGGVGVRISETSDVYDTREQGISVKISSQDVNHLLGLHLTPLTLTEVLTRAGFGYQEEGEALLVVIPDERLDLRTKIDMIEEVGRHVGYENIEAILPDIKKEGIPNKRLFYANKIRKILIAQGFSEVFTYSFATPGAGELEVLSPVGKDRPYMRNALATGLHQSLLLNMYNAHLIGITNAKIFEIGNVFPENGEHASIGIALAAGSKGVAKSLLGDTEVFLKEMATALGVSSVGQVEYTEFPSSEGLKWAPVVCEFNFDKIIETLPEPITYEPLVSTSVDVRYRTLSAYPFIVRDIAIFVPQEVGEEYIETVLKKEAGELLVRISQFDKFQKPDEDRISYGYRMVFQSFDRTLTDDEVGAIMERVTVACNAEKDWQVR